LDAVIMRQYHFPFRIASIEWFKLWSLVWPCLPGECDV